MLRRPSLRRPTRDMFAAAVLLPIVLGLFSFWALKHYQDQVKWVSHAKDVLTAIDEVRMSITEAESTQRAYLLTREGAYLVTYQGKNREITDKLNTLRQLSSDNLKQQLNATRLQRAIWARMAKLDQGLTDARTGAQSSRFNSPDSTFDLTRGTEMMAVIRSICADMNVTENTLLIDRMQSLRDAELQLACSFTAGLLVSLALLIWSYQRIQEHSQERDQANRTLQSLNDDLEAGVRERTQELQTALEQFSRSNEDLTRFAYVASHDLREPLRIIGSFAGLLATRYKGRLDEQADEYLRHMVDGAKRMHSLVQDLLVYSRVGTQELNYNRVPIGAVLADVRRDLAGRTDASRGTIQCEEPLPIVWGDQIKLTQVFENLITNALKFARAGSPPKVSVSARLEAGEWVFCVQDNGIGFEPEYAQNIFVMFKRLHGAGKYEGTGIGLAICKRVIEAHEGRVWAESEPGLGSKFYFTLPARRPRRSFNAKTNDNIESTGHPDATTDETSAAYSSGGR